MKSILTDSKILRNECPGTKMCSVLGASMSLAMILGTLAMPARSAGGSDESRPMGVAASATKGQAYFLQPNDVVLFLGNSITAGAGPEMSFLAQDFKSRYPELADGKVKLITSGIHGEQAVSGAGRLKALLDQHKPTVCVVCYGTCEVTFKNEKSFIPAMKDIIRQLKAANVAVTVVSAPPPSAKNWHPSPWPAEQFVNGVPIMAAQAKQVAAEEGVLFVDAFTALKSVADKNNKELTVDGIHLNQDGYRVMADALQQVWGFGQPLVKTGSPRAVPPALKTQRK